MPPLRRRLGHRCGALHAVKARAQARQEPTARALDLCQQDLRRLPERRRRLQRLLSDPVVRPRHPGLVRTEPERVEVLADRAELPERRARVMRHHHGVARQDGPLEPEALTRVQRGDVRQHGLGRLALRDLEHAPKPCSGSRRCGVRRRHPPERRDPAERARHPGAAWEARQLRPAAGEDHRSGLARPHRRTVNPEPRDGLHRKATTPPASRASRRDRPSRATRPRPRPGTTRPPCAANTPSAGAPAGAAPGRNTTERPQAPRPAATTAASANASAPRAPPEPMPHPRPRKNRTTAPTCGATASGNARAPTTATNRSRAMTTPPWLLSPHQRGPPASPARRRLTPSAPGGRCPFLSGRALAWERR